MPPPPPKKTKTKRTLPNLLAGQQQQSLLTSYFGSQPKKKYAGKENATTNDATTAKRRPSGDAAAAAAAMGVAGASIRTVQKKQKTTHETHENNKDKDKNGIEDVEDDRVVTTQKPKKRNTPPPSKSTKSKKSSQRQQRTASATTTITTELQDRKNKARQGLTPPNNPQAMPSEAHVDSVGLDPTQGIVEGIVGAQMQKVGGFLLQQQKKQKNNSVLPFPIRLQTACSGTDAPSMALTLLQESMEHFLRLRGGGSSPKDNSDNRHDPPFSFTHEMSCELEPFKQAYLGRNFPGVPLFPGHYQIVCVRIGDGRLWTGPTDSIRQFIYCGNFLQGFFHAQDQFRKDIEDKGTSGQTFLAAVEFLEQQAPPCFIFENVDGAPWPKMMEYIEGKVQLSKRNDMTAIVNPSTNNNKSSSNADLHLIFSVDATGTYIAEQIPRQVGIRAGTPVQGFLPAAKGTTTTDAILQPMVSSRSGRDPDHSGRTGQAPWHRFGSRCLGDEKKGAIWDASRQIGYQAIWLAANTESQILVWMEML